MAEIASLICSGADCQTLDKAVLVATDFVECGEGSKNELRNLFHSIVEQIDRFGDREEALTCLSRCAIALGNVRESDLSHVLSLMGEFGKGETIALINVLANSDRTEYFETLDRLSEDLDGEVSLEAAQAIDELKSRTT